MTPLEDAAVAYVVARHRNDGAEPRDWTACAAEVDRCWHDLQYLATERDSPVHTPAGPVVELEQP